MRQALPLHVNTDAPALTTPTSPAADIVADLNVVAGAVWVLRGAWLVGTAYDANDVVTYGGHWWLAVAASTGVTPAIGAAPWSQVPGLLEAEAGALYDALGAASTAVAAIPNDGVAGVPSRRTLGTGAQQAAPGNDARFAGSPAGTAGAALAATAPIPESQVTGLAADLAARELTANKGQPSGYAALDSGGHVPTAQLPAMVINTVWANVTSQAAMLALAAEPGDVAVRTDVSANFMLAALPASTLGNWVQLADLASPVTSVAGRTGAVALATGDISGLGSAATHATTDFDAAGAATSAQAAAAVRCAAVALTFGA